LRHAIRGAISRETLRASRTITTLDGISRPVTVARDGTVRIDGVAIVDADIEATDATIHTLAAPLPRVAGGAGDGSGD
ncbi:MAG: fasciclin domain-containing protein, partial [Planctomycetota bacterium]